jgi:hypothetical protein
MLPNIIWPVKYLAADVVNGAACPVFAIAHWVAVVTGQQIPADDIQAAYEQERDFRGREAGLTIPEAFFAAYRAHWLPAGATIRRTSELSRIAYGPMLVSYRVRSNFQHTGQDGIIDDTGASLGTHTMLLIGWDGEYVILLNSFGTAWGDGGIGRMRLADHQAALIEMWQIVVPGQPSNPQEAAKAAADAIPDTLADQVAAVHRNLQVLGYDGLPTTATVIMPDIIQRSMAGELTEEQERAKSNLAHVYTMLLLQGIADEQINAVHAALAQGE